MLGEIFAWKQDEWYDELKTLGFYLGKFIYLMDAYEDRDKDEKKTVTTRSGIWIQKMSRSMRRCAV